MNTLIVGDKFEDKSYLLIEKAIENDELGISKSSTKVFRKKGYYSKDREKEIIFDLSIEIWPINAERYSLLFLIECKSSNSKKVPVDDVEEFYAKIIQVAGVNVKGVMISDNSFSSGGLTYAKNKGMMLIEVDKYDTYSIILHRTERDQVTQNEKDTEELFFSFIKKTLGIKKVIGLDRLSSEQIEKSALLIVEKYNHLGSSIYIPDFIDFLNLEYDLKIDLTKSLQTINRKKIQGYFDVKEKIIFIDNSITASEKFPFVLGHEVGHFFLHSNLKVNQETYNDFEDSEYDFFTDRHKLINEKHWIEWQANRFSISLFLPKDLFIIRLTAYRKSLGIRRPERIYLDKQPINIHDYYKTVDYLSEYFGTSKTSVKYRIEELKLITYANGKDDLRSLLRNALFD